MQGSTAPDTALFVVTMGLFVGTLGVIAWALASGCY